MDTWKSQKVRGRGPIANRPQPRYFLDMRTVVTRDRSWTCDELATTVLQRLVARYESDLVIVHGGDNGVDQSFNRACKSLGIPIEARVADRRGTGIPAIASRSRELIKDGADLCVALHRSIAASRRTRDCVFWGH